MARDCGDALASALQQAAEAAGVALTIVAVRSTHWASATFTGARHALCASAADTPALTAWLDRVTEQELAIRGQLVADLAIDAVDRRHGGAAIVFAALTVEDN